MQILNRSDETTLKLMQILSDETRYRLFKILSRDDQQCVSELSALLGISTSAVSQQFRIMELSGMVAKKRHGQKICYFVDQKSPLVAQFKKLQGGSI